MHKTVYFGTGYVIIDLYQQTT
ncbi:hypothetical protein D299_gp262 [Escherichia phage HX01]|nr:hypothetical protein D299_gp262 [Escherichia phage HX01]